MKVSPSWSSEKIFLQWPANSPRKLTSLRPLSPCQFSQGIGDKSWGSEHKRRKQMNFINFLFFRRQATKTSDFRDDVSPCITSTQWHSQVTWMFWDDSLRSSACCSKHPWPYLKPSGLTLWHLVKFLPCPSTHKRQPGTTLKESWSSRDI